MRVPHPMVAYRQFWDDAPLEFLHYQFEPKLLAMADTWVQAHPLAPGVVAAVASGGGGGGFQAGHSRLKKHDEV